MNAIRVKNLSVHYDKTPVLWEIDFTIPKGHIVGVVGPNGAGKSTLLKTLLGLLKPIAGTISFFERPYKEVQKKIAYVPQRTSVDWNFPISVLDVVLMGLYGKRGPLKWVRKRDRILAEKALVRVGMLPFAKRQISELSGGQQQRVFLARALLQDADLYLMDEPFAGVDMATEKALMEVFSDLKDQGKTLLIVHHDLTTVKNHFDWVILLNSCLIDCGPISEVFHEENLKKAYGNAAYLLTETKKLTHSKSTGV
ncbi:MAG: High-affinity zinc uptake system ATP-binding protein ZnuC [Chlamydiae bacterium]|nr:High-affinity zinc uptake system ATP-binding protein ZnuC [Chlamydiota bacterium]